MQPTLTQRLELRKRPKGRAVMRQQWADLLFLHWSVEPAMIQSLLPQGLFVDTFAVRAWLGVVPFSMNRIRPSLLPPVPGISWFLELNVRTYVHDEHGTPGVWFFSLDCNQALAVSLAQQWFHLPYEHALMKLQRGSSSIEYSCRRDVAAAKSAEFRYQVCQHGKEAEHDSLEFFLLERYLLFSSNKNGQLYCGQVHHVPYRAEEAKCDVYSSEPLVWDGFVVDAAPASILTARTVDVEIFPLRRL